MISIVAVAVRRRRERDKRADDHLLMKLSETKGMGRTIKQELA
jgi:hypothetical protein